MGDEAAPAKGKGKEPVIARMIKSGNYSTTPWTGTASCPECMALMAIDEDDLNVINDMASYVACMECGCHIALRDGDAPPIWVLRRVFRDRSK